MMGDCYSDVSEENGDASNESEALSMETISEANLGEHNKRMRIEPKEGKISQLPDEVLVSILSLLPTTQSVRTSVLAKRWKNLWKSVQHLDLIFRSCKFSNFRFLKSSTIHGKNVMNRYKIDHILSKCPFLEEFRLVGSNVVFNLVIVSASLKKLEILGCCNMQKLKISAPNLVSFKYSGPDIKYVFGDVPRLVEVSFVDSYCGALVRREFEQFKPILHQLIRVNLILDFPWIKGFPLVHGLAHMKELRLDVRVWDTTNPLFLAWSVLVGMPFLDLFILRLFWPENHEALDLGGVELDECDEFEQGYTFKVFEMDGCISAGFELEFVKFVVDKAFLLEKLVVRVARRASVESEEDLMDIQEREEAIENAREYITSILPRPICFELL